MPNYECDKPDGVHAIFHKILAELNQLSLDYDLDLANRLYADYSIDFIQVTFANGALYYSNQLANRSMVSKTLSSVNVAVIV